MTHLLPGGGVPRVHRARSPVPPRLPHFATPRSLHRLASVAAGAYPPCRPPDVWSPGAPAPPGPCYWLVASGTPVGWRGCCLALGLVRGAVRHYCLGGCSALVVCARRSQPVRGARACAWCRVLPVSPFPPRVSCSLCGGPSRPRVPCPRSLVRHSMRSVRSAASVPAGRRGRGGPVCAGGGVRRQRSAVSGLRGSGPPLIPGASVLRPSGGGARPYAAPYGRGEWGRGVRLRRGGRPAALSPAPPPPRPLPEPTGRGCHRRCHMCRGWGCGGGGFRRR